MVPAAIEERSKAEFLHVHLTRSRIAPVVKDAEAVPNHFFSDPDVITEASASEGEESQKLHALLSKYLQSKDPKDRGVYRQQLIPAYWNLIHRVALKRIREFPDPETAHGRRRRPCFHRELQDTVQRIVHKKELDEPFYYMDEWLRAVALGHRTERHGRGQSRHQDDLRSRFNAILQRAQGSKDTAESLMKVKAESRKTLEGLLRDRLADIVAGTTPSPSHVPAPHGGPEEDHDRIPGHMLLADRSCIFIEAFKKRPMSLSPFTRSWKGLVEDVKANFQALAQEFETARQMTSSAWVGRATTSLS